MVKLKVCGITSYDDAATAVDTGADYLGFNFYRPSPRYIAPEAARAIIERLPRQVITAGIFVNEPDSEEVSRIMHTSGVQMAQLHGDESADYCARLGATRVIKAFRAGAEFDPALISAWQTEAILLDAWDKQLYGGTGRTADWSVARDLATSYRLFLAGGLAPENITDAILAVHPFAIDVNSGVESAPGKKDPGRLRALRRALDQISY